MMPLSVNDPEKEKQNSSAKPNEDGSHDDLGVHPERREAEAAELEKQFNAPAAEQSPAAREEAAAFGMRDNGAERGFFNNHGGSASKHKGSIKQRVLGLLKNRRVQAGAAGGGIIGVLIGAFIIISGPLQIIHFAQMLEEAHFGNQEDFDDGRSARFMRNIINRTPERSRLGAIANKYADTWEQKLNTRAGLRSVYRNDTGRFVGYEIIDQSKARPFLNEMNQADINTDADMPPGVHGARNTELGNGRFVDLQDTRFRNRRASIRTASRSVGVSQINTRIGSRLHIIRSGADFHPLKNLVRKKTDDVADWRKKRKQERADRDKRGVISQHTINLPNSDPDGDGNQNNMTSDEQALRQEMQSIQADLQSGDIEEIKSKNSARLGAGSVASAVGLLCTAREISNRTEQIQHTNVVLPMIRIAIRIMATGSQVMAASTGVPGADVNLDELGSVITDLTNEEGVSFTAARGLQHEFNQELTGPDLPPEAKPFNGNGKPALLQIVDNIFGALPGISTAACSRVGGFVLTLVGITPAAAAFEVVKETAFAAGAPNPEELFIEWISNKMAGNEVDVLNASGPLLGNYANTGALLAANDLAIAGGGRELSSAEVSSLDKNRVAEMSAERSRKNILVRLFDPYDYRSSFAQVVQQVPLHQNPKKTIANLARLPVRLLSSTLGVFASIFTTNVGAEDRYDYGVSEYGFSQEEQNDPRFDNPFENAAIVEQHLGILNEQYGKSCFNTTVELTDSGVRLITAQEGAKPYHKIPDKCYEDSNNDNIEDKDSLLRFRFYLADVRTELSLSCYEGDDSACSQLGFNGQDISSSNNTVNLPGHAVGIDETAVTKEGGGIRVHKSIVDKVDQMLSAAKTDGVALTANSGWRDKKRQEELREQNGCPGNHVYEPSCKGNPETAIPGTSMHERGLAIDFRGIQKCPSRSQAGKCSDPNSPNWSWLNNNASSFGFSQLNSEAWHWSTTGK